MQTNLHYTTLQWPALLSVNLLILVIAPGQAANSCLPLLRNYDSLQLLYILCPLHSLYELWQLSPKSTLQKYGGGSIQDHHTIMRIRNFDLAIMKADHQTAKIQYFIRILKFYAVTHVCPSLLPSPLHFLTQDGFTNPEEEAEDLPPEEEQYYEDDQDPEPLPADGEYIYDEDEQEEY